MKVDWRSELPQLALLLAMFVTGAVSWPYAPERLPVHWNIDGEVDRYGSRFEGLFLLPILAAGLYLLLLLLPKVDPGRLNYRNFAQAYQVIRMTILIFLAAVYAVLVMAVFGRNVDMVQFVVVGTGLVWIVLGTVMGKIRPNWFVGVRTPWTLSSKVSWVKSHRLAGWLLTWMGFIYLGLAAVENVWLRLVGITALPILIVAWVVSYSYVQWRRDPDRIAPAGTEPG